MEEYLSILLTIFSPHGSLMPGIVSVSLPMPSPKFTRLSSTERQKTKSIFSEMRIHYFSHQEVLRLTDYEGFHRKRKGNIFLLNAFFKDSGFSYPMKERLSYYRRSLSLFSLFLNLPVSEGSTDNCYSMSVEHIPEHRLIRVPCLMFISGTNI